MAPPDASAHGSSRADAAELIGRIEIAAANSLPCAEVEVRDGWRLRFNHGVTRRANAVLAEARGVETLDAKLEAVERFYTTRGLPARFQLSPASQPPGLDGVLEGRGYRHGGAVQVRVSSLDAVRRAGGGDLPGAEVELTPTVNGAWLALYQRIENAPHDLAAARARMFERIAPRRAFALLYSGGVPIAVGLGVVEDGLLGVFNMATDPRFRGRRAAGRLLADLAGWSGAQRLYLQVAEENETAQRAYERAGFTTMYRYHYRVRDRAG